MNKPAPVFTIASTSQRGQSLLQWHEDNDKLKRIGTLHSLQMPDHVAGYIVDSTAAFDKAGRELGIDAAILARSVDLAALITVAREVVAELDHDTLGAGTNARVLKLDHMLARLR